MAAPSYLSPTGDIRVGGFATSRLSLSVPSTINMGKATGYWELLDPQGKVWSRGDVVDIDTVPSQVAPGQNTVSAEANIAFPATLPVHPLGTDFQIRWTITPGGGQPMIVFESVKVMPRDQPAAGALDAAELFGDTTHLRIRLPEKYNEVTASIFRGNSKAHCDITATYLDKDADGHIYEVELCTFRLGGPSLDPLTVVWKYGENSREASSLFLVNPSMLDASQELQAWLNRAYTDMGESPGTTFTVIDYLKYLRFGRDQFNAADKPTTMTMLNAQGPIRYFWIGYACVQAARAQQLAEGMKAFDYGSQTTTLNVDRAPFWEAMASQMESTLNDQIKLFKDNLYKRGVIDGDGSNIGLRKGAVGTVGLTIHGASPILSPYGGGFMSGLWRR